MSSPNSQRDGGFDMRQSLLKMLNGDESSTVATEEDDEAVCSGGSLPGDEAEDEWSKENSFGFYFVKQFAYDDPDIKAKINEADQEIYHCNTDRIHIANTLKSKRAERLSMDATMDDLISSLDELHEINPHKEINEVEDEKEVITGKINSLNERLSEIKNEIELLDAQLACVLEQRDKAFDRIRFLRMQRDKGNAAFYQSRVVLGKAKLLAASGNFKELEELSNSEVEKFMSRWNDDKAFRDDYKKRILPSLDDRKLRCDGDVDSENGDETAGKNETEEESDDEDTLKEKKREEQVKKARLAMERRKKLQEKAAAKVAMKVKKEAERKLKEHEKKVERNKKAAAFNSSSSSSSDLDRRTETVTEASEPEKEKRLEGRSVFPKQRSFRGHGKVNETVPKAIMKRRKAYRLWVWTASCSALALVIIILILFFYVR